MNKIKKYFKLRWWREFEREALISKIKAHFNRDNKSPYELACRLARFKIYKLSKK